MPVHQFTRVLSAFPTALLAVYAYIRTFKSSAPDVKNIPALTAIIEAAKQEKK